MSISSVPPAWRVSVRTSASAERWMTEDRRHRTTSRQIRNPPSAIRNRRCRSLELEQRIRHLEWLATTDDLTGLKNRRYIWEFARQILDHARQTKGRVTLLVFDIDNFKHYNDVYGHLTGDEILRQAAVLMRRCCRQSRCGRPHRRRRVRRGLLGRPAPRRRRRRRASGGPPTAEHPTRGDPAGQTIPEGVRQRRPAPARSRWPRAS